MEVSRIITVVCPNCHLTTVLRRLENPFLPPVWSLGHETLFSRALILDDFHEVFTGLGASYLLSEDALRIGGARG